MTTNRSPHQQQRRALKRARRAARISARTPEQELGRLLFRRRQLERGTKKAKAFWKRAYE